MAAPLKTNVDRLLRISVEVQPVHPAQHAIYRVGPDGSVHVGPGVGGITLNLKVGDPALGWVADHAEPCVTTRNTDNGRNSGVAFLACIGNPATVITGDAKGDQGIVTGKHGGVEHTMIDFADDTLAKLTYGDTIRIDSFGQGLALFDAGDIIPMNLDPGLLTNPNWGVKLSRGRMTVPVAHIVPAKLMGSGLGRDNSRGGDYDIQLFDSTLVEDHGLASLRLGDIVAITDADHSFGRIYRTGAVSISVITHGACATAGHGPGATTLLTSATGAIVPVRDAKANLASILGVGRERTAPRKPRRPSGKK